MKKVYLDKTESVWMLLQDEYDVLDEQYVVGRFFVSKSDADEGEVWDEWVDDDKIFDSILGREAHDDEIPDHLKEQM